MQKNTKNIQLLLSIIAICINLITFMQNSSAQSPLLSKEELGKQKEFLDLKQALRKPAQVYKLSLWDMALQEISPNIGKLTNLQQLRISHNELASLPATFAQLTRLQRLNMEHNNFTEIPAAIFQFANLEKLDIHKNKLKAIPPTLAQLSLLEELDLHANQISDISVDTIKKLPNLKQINLSENPIPASKIEELKQAMPQVLVVF